MFTKKYNFLSQTNNIRVLLVDDAVLITKRLAEFIGEINNVSEIFTAHNYADAVVAIEKNLPDLVLLDIHLPDKSGIELLDFLRKEFPAIKVIMVTNKASQYYRDLCTSLGCHHFIDKSKEFETIPSLIKLYS